MKHMYDKPSVVFVLTDEGARRLSDAEADAFMQKYEDTGWEPRLESLYEACGCSMIDVRDLPGLGQLWFDDEGRLAGKGVNPVASALYEHCYRTGEGILGDAVLVLYPDATAGAAFVETLSSQWIATRDDARKNAN